jgi:hypothetical protein
MADEISRKSLKRAHWTRKHVGGAGGCTDCTEQPHNEDGVRERTGAANTGGPCVSSRSASHKAEEEGELEAGGDSE